MAKKGGAEYESEFRLHSSLYCYEENVRLFLTVFIFLTFVVLDFQLFLYSFDLCEKILNDIFPRAQPNI